MARISSGLLTVLAGATLCAGGARAANTQVIYSFAGGTDGEYADTDLEVDAAGNIYGSTVQGGHYSSGTVFQLTPSTAGWIHTVVYSFTGGADGGEPYKGVSLDRQGNLYGTAGVGGVYTGPCVDTGCGVVFKLSHLANGSWRYTVIHNFTGGQDGYGPGSRVTVDSQGNVYGTTPTGGAHGFGVVFQLTPDASGHYTEKVIHTFTGGNDGSGGSAGRLIVGPAGNILGVCTTGGAHGAGVVFALAPTASGEWKLGTLYAFLDEPNSGFPYGNVVMDAKGNLYGTTYYAGANDLGTVYKLSYRNGAWTQTWLYSFKGGTDGDGPISTLAADAAGNLYGTASEGGASCGCGTIFKIDLSGAAPAYSVVYRFKGVPDGGFVYNGMTADASGTVLYGATVHGGTSDDGAIFRFTP